jgi:hypothetical protein
MRRNCVVVVLRSTCSVYSVRSRHVVVLRNRRRIGIIGSKGLWTDPCFYQSPIARYLYEVPDALELPCLRNTSYVYGSADRHRTYFVLRKQAPFHDAIHGWFQFPGC